MADKKNIQIQNIPPQMIYFLCVAAIIGAVATGYFAFYEPAQMQVKSAQRTLNKKQIELGKLQVLEKEYNLSRTEFERLETQLKNLQNKLPSTANELNHFLDSVNQRARASRITDWSRFKQEGTVAEGDITKIPIRMEFSASYEAAIQFFWDLASMGDGYKGSNREQLINIHDVNMDRQESRNAESAEPEVKVTCVAETYLFTGNGNAAQGN